MVATDINKQQHRQTNEIKSPSERLQDALNYARSKGESVTVMLLHAAAIDRVDAQHGFDAGASFLNRILDILHTKVLRKFDEIELLGRDEFICILPAVSSEGVARLAAQRVLTHLNTSPIEFDKLSGFADISIGIAIFPEHGNDAGTLMQHAKQALLTAHKRIDKTWIYEGRDSDSVADQSLYTARLRAALDGNRLSLHYMPQVSLRTGDLSGAEALMRWTDEKLGVVQPNVLIQVAETNGLMDQLSQWVITSAIQQYAKFSSVDPDFKISINLSPSNLGEPDLSLFISRALRTWNVESRNIVIEITESAMIANQESAIDLLHQLKSCGLQLSIDDFGTGYSSMYYLARMPLDELKIDQSFVRDMLESPVNAKIVRSLIELAHNLELSVVAEGVENKMVMNKLAELGCDYVQGYHIGKAVPETELMERLRQRVSLR